MPLPDQAKRDDHDRMRFDRQEDQRQRRIIVSTHYRAACEDVDRISQGTGTTLSRHPDVQHAPALGVDFLVEAHHIEPKRLDGGDVRRQRFVRRRRVLPIWPPADAKGLRHT